MDSSVEVATMPTVEAIRINGLRTEWLTADEAAGYLRVKTRTLLLWARRGRVRGYPLSGIRRRVWRFRKVDLDAALLGDRVGVLCSVSPSVLVTKGVDT